ncbi:30954_t:CDS:2, partial [Gigaspora margarita]
MEIYQLCLFFSFWVKELQRKANPNIIIALVDGSFMKPNSIILYGLLTLLGVLSLALSFIVFQASSSNTALAL